MDRHDNSVRRKYDPRIGDEGPGDGDDSPIQGSDASRTEKTSKPPFVRRGSSQQATKENDEKKSEKKLFTLPSSLAWIPPNLTWPKWKIVIRCAIAAWVSVVLMVIDPVLKTMGQVRRFVVGRKCSTNCYLGRVLDHHRYVRPSFFRTTRTDSAIASFLSPPSDPFVANLEREFFILAFVSAAWGYVLSLLYLYPANSVPAGVVSASG